MASAGVDVTVQAGSRLARFASAVDPEVLLRQTLVTETYDCRRASSRTSAYSPRSSPRLCPGLPLMRTPPFARGPRPVSPDDAHLAALQTHRRDGRYAHRAGYRPVPLLTLRAAFILMMAVLASGITGVLAYLTSKSLPGAFLAAGAACATTITVLNVIIG